MIRLKRLSVQQRFLVIAAVCMVAVMAYACVADSAGLPVEITMVLVIMSLVISVFTAVAVKSSKPEE